MRLQQYISLSDNVAESYVDIIVKRRRFVSPIDRECYVVNVRGDLSNESDNLSHLVESSIYCILFLYFWYSQRQSSGGHRYRVPKSSLRLGQRGAVA